MIIEASKTVRGREAFQLTKKFLSFPRASSSASILFSVGHRKCSQVPELVVVLFNSHMIFLDETRGYILQSFHNRVVYLYKELLKLTVIIPQILHHSDFVTWNA